MVRLGSTFYVAGAAQPSPRVEEIKIGTPKTVAGLHPSYSLTFREGFAGAFRSTAAELGLNESTFQKGRNLQSESGTRFAVEFINVPLGTEIYVTVRNQEEGSVVARLVRDTNRTGQGSEVCFDCDGRFGVLAESGVLMERVDPGRCVVWEFWDGEREQLDRPRVVTFGVGLLPKDASTHAPAIQVVGSLAPFSTTANVHVAPAIPYFMPSNQPFLLQPEKPSKDKP